jgi:hypothetical protein
MLKADNTKMTRAQIEEAPGELPSKIIFNQLVNNRFRVWIIGHQNGVLFFNVSISVSTNATVAFTTRELAEAYINRKEVRNSLLQHFGGKVMLIHTTVQHLQHILNEQNASFLNNLVINPNPSGEFFIPMSMKHITEMVNKGIMEFDYAIDADYDIIEMVYDKETVGYIEAPGDQPSALFSND